MTREEAIEILKRVDICANAAETARDMAIAALREQPVTNRNGLTGWISVEDRLPEPEREVLVSCKTRPSGYEYRCLAFYVPEKWLREESHYNWDYEACNEYCEEKDDYYVNEGWYESIHNWDDYNAVVIGDFVTHWMPLPEPPEVEV